MSSLFDLKEYTVLKPIKFAGRYYKPDDETCNVVQMREKDAVVFLNLKMILKVIL